MTVTIEIFIGNDAEEYVEQVSELRVQIFREYPYLYEGSVEYEKNYVKGYTSDKKAMIAIARVDGEIAGISTGIPLVSDSEIVADSGKIFESQGINVNDYYYYGEVIVLPKFRGAGLVTKLFREQDEVIRGWGYKHVSILTVIREPNHPLAPVNYASPDGMWGHLGFFRNNYLTTNYHWPTIQFDGAVRDVSNTLEFWTKSL